MEMRDRITAALKDAMRAKEADRLSTLRLINAAIKDRDIALRGTGDDAAGLATAAVLWLASASLSTPNEDA